MREDHWLSRLMRLLRLTHEAEDHAIIHESIEKAIVFRGTNLWILVFAILVASVGLNMNSTAVVIGAMLISPLMGPINGVGYSVATYNFKLLRKSLNNLAFAASAGLVASTLYFVLTPIHTEHSELLARTSPTIYDVLIATFGGLAGIVALSSKNKGNVIPGVAIATALMPPLCTAGYGISIGNWGYFFGALYLFLINSVFIALSSMVVSQLMNFPKSEFLLDSQIKNKNITVVIVALITVAPAVYLGVTLVQKEKFKAKAEHFVEKVNVWEGNYLLDNTINPEERMITLVYGGNEFDEKAEKRLHDKAEDLQLGEAELIIKQGLKIGDLNTLQAKSDEINEREREINRLKATLLVKEQAFDSITRIPSKGEYLLDEIRALYPQVESCSYAPTNLYVDSLNKSLPTEMVFFTVSESDTLGSDDKYKIERWLKHRLKTKRLIVKF